LSVGENTNFISCFLVFFLVLLFGMDSFSLMFLLLLSLSPLVFPFQHFVLLGLS